MDVVAFCLFVLAESEFDALAEVLRVRGVDAQEVDGARDEGQREDEPEDRVEEEPGEDCSRAEEAAAVRARVQHEFGARVVEDLPEDEGPGADEEERQAQEEEQHDEEADAEELAGA